MNFKAAAFTFALFLTASPAADAATMWASSGSGLLLKYDLNDLKGGAIDTGMMFNPSYDGGLQGANIRSLSVSGSTMWAASGSGLLLKYDLGDLAGASIDTGLVYSATYDGGLQGADLRAISVSGSTLWGVSGSGLLLKYDLNDLAGGGIDTGLVFNATYDGGLQGADIRSLSVAGSTLWAVSGSGLLLRYDLGDLAGGSLDTGLVYSMTYDGGLQGANARAINVVGSTLWATSADGLLLKYDLADLAGAAIDTGQIYSPSYDGGLQGADIVALSVVPDPVGAVPEPDAWLLMISGFGGAGATLRLRRRRSTRMLAQLLA